MRNQAILFAFLGCFFFASINPCSSQVLVWGGGTNSQTNVPPSLTNAIAISGGDYHCMALNRDGTVVAWGGDNWGQSDVPPGLSNIVAINAGGSHSAALRPDGTVAYWGMSYYGADTNVAQIATNIVALAQGSGAEHSAAIRADNTVLVWGDDYYGFNNVPPQAEHIVSVVVGEYSVLALRADGIPVIWGASWGFGSPPVPAVPSNATNIIAISCGFDLFPALRADGTILSFGSPSVRFFPTPTSVIDTACPFSATTARPLALHQDGSLIQIVSSGPQYLQSYPANKLVAIAGGSSVGMALVGSGPPAFQTLPVNRTVGSGMNAFFRLPAAGAMPLQYQWNRNGTNLPGQTNALLTVTNVQPSDAGSTYTLTVSNSLGSITSGPMLLNEVPFDLYFTSSASASVIGASITFSAQTIGSGPFTYQWLLNGTNLLAATNSSLTLTDAQFSDAGLFTVIVTNRFGALSNSLPLTITPTITLATPLTQGTFAGGSATLSISLEAAIPVSYQWQLNGVDLVGETNASLDILHAHSTNAGVYSVIFTDQFERVTNYASLSILNVATWGDQLQSAVPNSLTNAIQIAAGLWHELALKADGTVVAWGLSEADVTNVPQGLSNVVALAAGSYFSDALKNDGTVVSWGRDFYGDTRVPLGLSNVVAIADGDFHTLALKSDGTVVAWGNDTNGQSDVPPGLSNVVAVAAGLSNSVALRDDGSIVWWGAGSAPQDLPPLLQIGTEDLEGVALAADGSVLEWGGNSSGEANPPAAATNIVAIGDAIYEVVGLRADGTVLAWGLNQYDASVVPAGLTNVIAISQCDGFHVMALVGNGPPVTSTPFQNISKSVGGFAVSIPSMPGHVYRLESKDSLAAASWNPFPLQAGTGQPIQLSDFNPGPAQRFYRVRRW